jgi:hypothetical protein
MKIASRLKEGLHNNYLLTRYIDIHGFLYFITQSKLRFARLDTFEDLNEGFSVYTADAVKDVTKHLRAIAKTPDKEKMMEDIASLKQEHTDLAKQYSQQQENLFACCWYRGEKESVAMWNLYSNADSVAIRFNAHKLIELIESIANKGDQHFDKMQYGNVEYADLSAEGNNINDDSIGFIKDVSFSHEQEFRFMAERKAKDDAFEYELCLGDLKKIDFSIIAHPKMEEWKIRNILNVLSCYQLTGKFQPSQLALKNNFKQQ